MDNNNTQDRRSFIKTCLKVLPAATLIPFLSIDAKAFAEEGYNPEDHNYAMGIDVHKCIGCGRCVRACKNENNVPDEPFYFRTWIERYIIPFEGETIVDSPDGGINGFGDAAVPEDAMMRTFFVPKICNHCAKPPCVQVCPVGATFTSRDGVVLVDNDYCIGCRYCIQACPYGARYLNPYTRTVDKCTFCYHRITKGLLPACVEACPTQARVFGEITDKSTPISYFRRFNEIQVLKPALNTEPKVFYAHLDGEVR
ncbi:4Fe-4S dicluster domain-containing protein [candidate division KSB1 bacterium]|nr:4Fe-4S dicluster domain-containing protein [candidate division KSB1 bacterium]